MPPLRLILAERSRWFAAFLACALAARLLVPAGFMPVVEHGRVTLQLCPGTVPAPASTVHAMAGMAAMSHEGDGGHGEAPRAEMPCAFSGLSPAALGPEPPVPGGVAAVFAQRTAVRRPVAGPPARARLRPPLRAPPALA